MRIDCSNSFVPENIIRIIAQKGLKQGFVAKNAGYTDHQMTAMLKGRRIIKVCDLLRLADALEVSVNELCAYPDSNKNRDSA